MSTLSLVIRGMHSIMLLPHLRYSNSCNLHVWVRISTHADQGNYNPIFVCKSECTVIFIFGMIPRGCIYFDFTLRRVSIRADSRCNMKSLRDHIYLMSLAYSFLMAKSCLFRFGSMGRKQLILKFLLANEVKIYPD